jgi:hypothetical protein
LKSKGSKGIEITPSEDEAHRELLASVQILPQEAKGQEGYSERERPEQNTEITSRATDLAQEPQNDPEVKPSRSVNTPLSLTNNANREADALASLGAEEQKTQLNSRGLFDPEDDDKKRQLEISRDQDPIEEFHGGRDVPQNGEEVLQRLAPESTVDILEAHSNGDTRPQTEAQTCSRGFLPIFNKWHNMDVTVETLRSIPVQDEDETNTLKKQLDGALRTIPQLQGQSCQAENDGGFR